MGEKVTKFEWEGIVEKRHYGFLYGNVFFYKKRKTFWNSLPLIGGFFDIFGRDSVFRLNKGDGILQREIIPEFENGEYKISLKIEKIEEKKEEVPNEGEKTEATKI